MFRSFADLDSLSKFGLRT